MHDIIQYYYIVHKWDDRLKMSLKYFIGMLSLHPRAKRCNNFQFIYTQIVNNYFVYIHIEKIYTRCICWVLLFIIDFFTADIWKFTLKFTLSKSHLSIKFLFMSAMETWIIKKSCCFELKIKPIYPNPMCTLHGLCLQLKVSLKDHFSERMKIRGLYLHQMSKTLGLCTDAPPPPLSNHRIFTEGREGVLYTG